jgi:hypothetical protein
VTRTRIASVLVVTVAALAHGHELEQDSRLQQLVADDEARNADSTGREMVVAWNVIARQMQPNANVIVTHSHMFAIIHIGMHDGINSVRLWLAGDLTAQSVAVLAGRWGSAIGGA